MGNVGRYYGHFHTAKTKPEQKAEEERLQALPLWFVENFLPLTGNVHKGKYDKIWSGILASPPRGGVGTITFDGHLSVPTGPGNEVQKVENVFVTELVAARAAFTKWKDSLTTTSAVGEAGPNGGVVPVPGGEDRVDDLPSEEQPLRVRADILKHEIRDLSAQKSRMWSGLVVLPDTVAATVPIVENAAVAKKGDGGELGNICFLYAVSTSYDTPPDASAFTRMKHPSIWTEDFESFAKTVHQVVTGANKCYAAVVVSQTRSGGSGLSAQAGLTGVSGVIDVFRAEEVADRKNGVKREPWQVKHFVAIHSGLKQQVQRSVGGKLATSVLFLLSRGLADKDEGATAPAFDGYHVG